ncbi:MAG TPA: hypothetical protein VM555_10220, partial [Tahibacter sp.]|nr:hypothetical protein [Tahibacter sp.]
MLIASLLLGSLHANTAEAQQPGNNEFTHGNLLSTNGDVELNWRGVVFSPPFTQDYKYILTVDGVDEDVWSIYYRKHYSTNGTHTFQVRYCELGVCREKSRPVSVIVSLPSQTTPADPSPSFQSRVSFLYTGANPRQIGTNPASFDTTRISVIRGKTLGTTGTPLAGVRVELVGAAQFGYTLTQTNGEFDLAVNAASGMRLRYSKSGFLPSERTVEPVPRDFSFAPDVVLTAPDTAFTTVTFPNPEWQMARASAVSDGDGSRRATLIFPPDVTATVTDAQGNVLLLEKAKIRATEYTVGPRGGLAMPAELPPTSGYTYAVELSADEVPAGSSLDFDRPVSFYLENFVGMPVGMAVPAGYYDAQAGAWIAGDNGRVMKIVSVGGTPSTAELDVTGDGVADAGAALTSLGITDEERVLLAWTYTPGQELWRVPLTHFTPWDFNFPWGLPPGRKWPTLEDFKVWFRAWLRAAADCMFGSIIECQNQALRKSFGVAGSQITLNHRSEAQSGYKGDLSLDVPLFSDGKPDDLAGVTVQVFVAGHKFERVYDEAETAALTGNEIYVFDQWDGRDIYGRDVLGTAIANVRLGYTYRATYYSVPSQFEASFGQYPDILWQDVGFGRDDSPQITIWHMAKRLLGHWNARQAGLGGLTLSSHAVYDALSGVVQRGDGTIQTVADASRIVTTVAGIYGTPDEDIVDQMPWSHDIGPGAQAALDVRGMRVNAVATGRNGDKYFAVRTDTHNAVFRLDANGEISRIAGGGTNTSDNYVGPANDFDLGFTSDIAVGPDDSIYYADHYKGRIWRIGPNGILSRFAGNGDDNDPYAYDRDQDGLQARDVGMGEPVAIVAAKDGTVYVSQTLELPGETFACYPSVIRRIGTDGRVSTIFGRNIDDCDAPLPPDFSNLQETWAKISDLAFDNNGNLIAAVSGTGVRGYVLRLRSTGGSDVLAGNFEFLDEDPRITLGFNGVPATSTAVSPNGIAFDANGGFYLAEGELIRYVDDNGIISLAAGNLTCPAEWDEPLPEGAAASAARVCEALSVTVDPNGDVFFADYHL